MRKIITICIICLLYTSEYRPEFESYIFDSDTDWFKEITQTPVSHKHNLSISGGSEKFSHHTSFNTEAKTSSGITAIFTICTAWALSLIHI